MNKKISWKAVYWLKNAHHHISLPAIVQAAAFIGLLTIGTVGMTQEAHAAQSLSTYCSQFKSQEEVNACGNGARGDTDCNDFVNYDIFGDSATDQKATSACNQAAKDRAKIDLTTPSPSPSPSTSASPTPSPTPSGAAATQIQNLLDQAKNLSDYIDVLHGINTPQKDASGNSLFGDTSGKDDTKYASYVNGAGKDQPIKVIKKGTGSSPFIVFINGGGWHGDDCMGQNVVNGGGDGEGCGNSGNPVEPTMRGYAAIEVTYRLGSSGVYYMYEDVMRGIQHVRNNAAQYGVDPNKMVIWGDSAGGSLAMRAAASGKTGAKAAVGWSAPTNAYTALFHSIASLAIGIDHSTCAPTDLAGLANFANLVNGGSGDVAKYGEGLSSNDFSAIGIDSSGAFNAGSIDPLAVLNQGVIAGKNALSTLKDFESISSGIKGRLSNYNFKDGIAGVTKDDLSHIASSSFNIASKKFAECLDNFNVLSPALFASPDTPPTFTAEFDNDGDVGTDQAYGMRDKLRQLGIKADTKILHSTDDCIKKAPDIFGTGCHLGYYADIVCPTFDFIDSVVQPEKGQVKCGSGVADAQNGGGGANGCPTSTGLRITHTPPKIQLTGAVSAPAPFNSSDGKQFQTMNPVSPGSGGAGTGGGQSGTGTGTDLNNLNGSSGSTPPVANNGTNQSGQTNQGSGGGGNCTSTSGGGSVATNGGGAPTNGCSSSTIVERTRPLARLTADVRSNQNAQGQGNGTYKITNNCGNSSSTQNTPAPQTGTNGCTVSVRLASCTPQTPTQALPSPPQQPYGPCILTASIRLAASTDGMCRQATSTPTNTQILPPRRISSTT